MIVERPWDYLISSAKNYADLDGLLEVQVLDHKPLVKSEVNKARTARPRQRWPVNELIVEKPEDYVFSSVRNYTGLDSYLDVVLETQQQISYR